VNDYILRAYVGGCGRWDRQGAVEFGGTGYDYRIVTTGFLRRGDQVKMAAALSQVKMVNWQPAWTSVELARHKPYEYINAIYEIIKT
jgi:hypothetical protein